MQRQEAGKKMNDGEKKKEEKFKVNTPSEATESLIKTSTGSKYFPSIFNYPQRWSKI